MVVRGGVWCSEMSMRSLKELWLSVVDRWPIGYRVAPWRVGWRRMDDVIEARVSLWRTDTELNKEMRREV